jgi:hypothetical protein
MDRRRFLTTAVAGGATFSLGYAARAKADWGDPLIPQEIQIVWPNGRPDVKVLEIFLYGGISPWETFYHRPDLSDPWLGFANEFAGVDWSCSGQLASGLQTESFGNDALTQAIDLGPATHPLWRADIQSRLRLVVLNHDLRPHEAAIPYALTGHRLGRPQLAGMGAQLSHYWSERSPRVLPYSYVSLPAATRFPTDNVQASWATGMHGGSHRPLTLRLTPGSNELQTLLARSDALRSADPLLNQYRALYRDQLRAVITGPVTRSAGHAAYEASAAALLRANDILTQLQAANLDVAPSPTCPSPGVPSADNVTASGIRLAAYLLSRPPAEAARYVCVIDAGHIEHMMGGGYDTYSFDHTSFTSMNLYNVLRTLADVIRAPGETTPNKINLDDTLVLLTTEFGRTPTRNGDGRDHWEYGYVCMLIGGPITTAGIAGAINDGHVAEPQHAFTATDMRAAALLAAGVYPFAPGNYNVGDVSLGLRVPNSEAGTAVNLRAQILGI